MTDGSVAPPAQQHDDLLVGGTVSQLSPRADVETLQDAATLARVRTSCSRLCALVRRWDSLTDSGLSLATEMVNARLSERLTTPTLLGSLTLVADAQPLFETHCFDRVRSLFPQLERICLDLKTISEQMSAVGDNLKAASSDGGHVVVGLGASLNQLCTSTATLAALYVKESAVRSAICDALLDTLDRGGFHLLLTTWMSEPYIHGESRIKQFVLDLASHVADTDK
eukprot:m.214626 g.214626  ORF g.214626 m.214626 type:complete len:226 (+) comp27263_c0_seq1:246-923(+)